MQIYLTKNAHQIGPFSEEEIRAQLECGEAKDSDLAWCEGRSDWVPLSEILSITPEPTRTSEPVDSPEILDASGMTIEKPKQIVDGNVVASKSGPPSLPKTSSTPPNSAQPGRPLAFTKGQRDKRIIAGLLGIFLGGLGVHKFYLGYTKEGIIQLIITLVTCGLTAFIGLVEGIIYLTNSNEKFVSTYVNGRKGWF